MVLLLYTEYATTTENLFFSLTLFCVFSVYHQQLPMLVLLVLVQDHVQVLMF